MAKKVRLQYFDIAKGIGILLVIIGHVSGIPLFLKKFIYSFHMPLFFLISGYFCRQRSSRKECFTWVFKRLLVPYLLTCLLIILYKDFRLILAGHWQDLFFTTRQWVFASLYGSGAIRLFDIPYIGAIWFLLALSVAILLMHEVYPTKYVPVSVCILAYIGYKTSKYIWLPLSIQAGMVALIFLYIGILLKKYDGITKCSSLLFYLVSFSLLLFNIFYGGNLYMVTNTYGNGLLDIIGAVSTSILVIKFCQLLEAKAKGITRPLAYLGKNSLLCLCLHLFSLDCLKWQTAHRFLTKIGISYGPLRGIICNFLFVLVGLAVIKLGCRLKNKISFFNQRTVS